MAFAVEEQNERRSWAGVDSALVCALVIESFAAEYRVMAQGKRTFVASGRSAIIGWAPAWLRMRRLQRETARALVIQFEQMHPGVTEKRVAPIAKLLRRAWDPTGLRFPGVPRALYTAYAQSVYLGVTKGKTDEQLAMGLDDLGAELGCRNMPMSRYLVLAAAVRDHVDAMPADER